MPTSSPTAVTPTATNEASPTPTATNTPSPTNEVTKIQRTYYSIAGQAVGVRVKKILTNGSTESDDMYYMYTDHLGNVGALSDENGSYISGSLTLFRPFGDFRRVPSTNPDITDHAFTGHKSNNTGDNDLGLIYMQARFYLPEVGRFLSADSIVPDPKNPQQLNRYSYGLNNPVKYSDPTGHCVFGLDTAICVAAAIGAGASLVVDYGLQVYDNIDQGMDPIQAASPHNINFSQLIGSTVAGGVGGAIAAPIAGLAGSQSTIARLGFATVGGAAGGVAGGQMGALSSASVDEVASYYNGQGFSGDDLIQEAIANGFLAPESMLIDAGTGAAFAFAGEGLKSVLGSAFAPSSRYSPTPLIEFKPVLNKGVSARITLESGEVYLEPNQFQALMQALSQNSREVAIDLLVEWYGTDALNENN